MQEKKKEEEKCNFFVHVRKRKKESRKRIQVGRRLSRSNKQLSVFTSSSLLHSIKVNGDEDDAKA